MDRYYNSAAQITDGAGLVIAGIEYARAIERGAYYYHTGYRRPRGRYLFRLEKRVRRAILNGRDVNAVNQRVRYIRMAEAGGSSQATGTAWVTIAV